MSDCVRFTTAGMPSQRTDGFGAWSGEGCMLTDETTTQVTCTCNRLGTFAVIQVSCPLNVWSSTTLCCFNSMHPRASTSSLVPGPYFRSDFIWREKGDIVGQSHRLPYRHYPRDFDVRVYGSSATNKGSHTKLRSYDIRSKSAQSPSQLKWSTLSLYAFVWNDSWQSVAVHWSHHCAYYMYPLSKEDTITERFSNLIAATPFHAAEVCSFDPPMSLGHISLNKSHNGNRDWVYVYEPTAQAALLQNRNEVTPISLIKNYSLYILKWSSWT